MHKPSGPVLDAEKAAATIRRACKLRPQLAMILGSGFHYVRQLMTVEARLPYSSVPGFLPMSIEGHAGEVCIGHLADTPVIVLNGRAHFYEGHDMRQVTFPIRALKALGVQDVLMTNASGGINPRFRAGDFMLVEDHINLMGQNPLRGPNEPEVSRFIDLTQAYDTGLASLLNKAARKVRVTLRRGVYVAVSGPSYETPAEIRAFARLGANAVGMSTVPEVIVARQCDLKVAVVSCITNPAAGLGGKSLSHQDVLACGERAKSKGQHLLVEFAKLYAIRPS